MKIEYFWKILAIIMTLLIMMLTATNHNPHYVNNDTNHNHQFQVIMLMKH